MAASVAPLMVGATGFTLVRVLADGGTSIQAARVMMGGTIATAALLGLESVRPEFARGLAAIAFISSALVHGERVSKALLGSIENVSTVVAGAGQTVSNIHIDIEGDDDEIS